MPLKIAVVCASGIGDSLIMHMVSHHLKTLGHEVTTFSNHLSSFGHWLSGYDLRSQPPLDAIEQIFHPFDTLFLQHDNSLKAKKMRALPLPIYTFYGAHLPSKHGPLNTARDFVCDRSRTMVENALSAMNRFFGSSSKENGLKAPEGLLHRKWRQRIAIHPTSSSNEKNWPREKFHSLARQLQKMGYEPVFTVAPEERAEWNSPLFSTLADLASFLYESNGCIGNDSGTIHLASYLNIPYLLIKADPTPLWSPGWGKGEIATLPAWAARWNMIKPHWKRFIPVKKVIKAFNKLEL